MYEEDGDGTVPQRFLDGCKGDEDAAQQRWALVTSTNATRWSIHSAPQSLPAITLLHTTKQTCAWRRSEKVDTFLSSPQPHFYMIKQLYPHYIHGRARNGCFVWYDVLYCSL